MKRKGILLAGGNSTRMGQLAANHSKQLIPINGIPMVMYSLATLKALDLDDILLICRPDECRQMSKLTGLDCLPQVEAKGIAQALLLAKDWLNGHPSVLQLGDNLFHGEHCTTQFSHANAIQSGALVFATPVKNPSNYGVVELDENSRPVSLIEKPEWSHSDLAVPGIYFYDHHAPDFAAQLKPSERGELEITDLNCEYLRRGQLTVLDLEESTTWIDIGTPHALARAEKYVQDSGCAPAAIDR